MPRYMTLEQEQKCGMVKTDHNPALLIIGSPMSIHNINKQ